MGIMGLSLLIGIVIGVFIGMLAAYYDCSRNIDNW